MLQQLSKNFEHIDFSHSVYVYVYSNHLRIFFYILFSIMNTLLTIDVNK